MLSNGARFYNDHAHPEYSTPECSTLREIVAQDKAGERILAECARAEDAIVFDRFAGLVDHHEMRAFAPDRSSPLAIQFAHLSPAVSMTGAREPT